MTMVPALSDKGNFAVPERPHLLRARLLQEHLIHVAPAPVFSRLDRLHDRMLAVMKVLGGVFVFG